MSVPFHVTGNSVCPALPRPSPCPNEPNQCIDKSECGAGRECCSDGCRMICVKPVAIPTTAVKTFREYLFFLSAFSMRVDKLSLP